MTNVVRWTEYEVERNILTRSRIMNILHGRLAFFKYL